MAARISVHRDATDHEGIHASQQNSTSILYLITSFVWRNKSCLLKH